VEEKPVSDDERDAALDPEIEEQPKAARPVTASARRERRASARAASATESADKTAKAEPVTADKKGKATPKRDRPAKGPSLIARLVRFFREVVGELRKVIWPTRKQLLTYTAVVLVFVSFMVALVFGLDYVFAKGVFWLFG
jgi:preprotein translocase subunit SecE